MINYTGKKKKRYSSHQQEKRPIFFPNWATFESMFKRSPMYDRNLNTSRVSRNSTPNHISRLNKLQNPKKKRKENCNIKQFQYCENAGRRNADTEKAPRIGIQYCNNKPRAKHPTISKIQFFNI